jgi:uncharacterized protein (DUF1684 family)
MTEKTILHSYHSVVTALIVVTTCCFLSCHRQSAHLLNTQDSLRIVDAIMAHRAEVDSEFRFDPHSPFNRDTTIRYEGIKWFPPDVHFHFKSKLYHVDHPETVSVFGTKGEERTQLKCGYFLIPFDGNEYRLNVYKSLPADARRHGYDPNYLSVWFTDETTGKETYGVGRYVEVGVENPNPDHLYTIDFNAAYNPYCAYSSLYSCAIPRKEDHLPFAVVAGEKKYHQ